MAIEVERLIATLEANFNKYDKALNKALGNTDRTFTRIERRGKQLESRLVSSGLSIGRRFAAGLAAGVSVAAFTRLSDAATRIDNALKVAGLSGENLEKVYGRLRDSAIKNAAPIEALVELYGRAALVQKELGISGEELLGFTDKIAVALRVSGKSAAESSGALLQLSQALGSGVVRAEEFNSILEGAQPIAQAAAAGLKEAGGSVAKLRQLVVDGKVSSEAFFRAFEAGSVILEDKVAGAQLTVNQALGNLQTSLIDAVREFNAATGASDRLAKGINNLAQGVNDLRIVKFFNQVSDAIDRFDRTVDKVANNPAMLWLAETLSGQDLTVGKPISLETVEAEKEVANLQRQIEILTQRIEVNKELGIDTAEAQAALDDLIRKASAAQVAVTNAAANRGYAVGTPGDPNALAQRATLGTAKVKPVSIDDAPVTGSGSKAKRQREADYAREVRQIQERTAALQAETAVMAGLNPLINDYGFAIEKAAAKQELLAAAKKQGLAITPELAVQIDTLASSYAQASVNAGVLAESQDRVRERMEEMSDLGRDVLGGFIDDLVAGESAADAFASALGKIGDKLLDIALNSLDFGSLFGGGSSFGTKTGFADMLGLVLHNGGRVGSAGTRRAVNPGVFAGAPRMHGGGLAGDEVPAILQKGEIVLPKGARATSGGVSVDARTTIDARGADQAAIARLQAALAKRDAELPAKIVETVRKANKTNVKFA